MVEKQINAQGGVVYWSAGPTQRDTLEAGLEAIGLRHYMPRPRTRLSGLINAAKHYAKESADLCRNDGLDYIVQNHKRPKLNGIEICNVDRKMVNNIYDSMYNLNVDADGKVSCKESQHVEDEIQVSYDNFMHLLTGEGVGAMLVKLLGHCQGVRLRESGGIYWIPNQTLPVWKKVTEAVEQAGHTNTCYLLRTVLDGNCIRAVMDAIASEVADAVNRMMVELESHSLQEKALENRLERCKALDSRISFYGAVLGKGLDELKDQVKKVQLCVTEASLAV